MAWGWVCLCAAALTLVRDMPFHYAGGFNPTLVELADALPYQAFTKNYIE